MRNEVLGTVRLRRWMLANAPRFYSFLGRTLNSIDGISENRRHQRFSLLELESPKDLVEAHYKTWVRRDVPERRLGFSLALDHLEGRPARIVETGTSAWGIDSTRLLDSYVRLFGGKFWTIDLRSAPSERLKNHLHHSTNALVGDSVDCLVDLSSSEEPMDLVYLDSWDLDWEDPTASALHCWREWEAVLPLCKPGTLVLIDDTPKALDFIPDLNPTWRPAASAYLTRMGRLPGKGELILEAVSNRDDVKILHHSYSLLLQLT